MAIKKILVFLIIIIAFAAGIYFKDNVLRFYGNVNEQVKNLQGSEIGKTISKASKQIFTSSPLNIGGASNKVVLLQSKIISETNLQRQQNGNLPALEENFRLSEAAAAKANDMFLNQYFEHVSPSGVDPGKLVLNYGYDYILEGENLILGNFLSEKELVQNWMDSPLHRANILNNRYTEIGIAVVKGTYKGQTVWIAVQEFGLPMSTCSEPSVALKDQIDSERAQLDIIASQINEKKNQIDNTDHNSPAYSQMINDHNQLVNDYNSLAEKTKADVATYNIQVNNFNNCVTGTK